MKTLVFGYARVSSSDQNEIRQIEELKSCGIDERNIYIDKISGKDFERDSYRALINRIREGDLIVITSLDRLGRNYVEIQKEWHYITQIVCADIKILDMPLLDTKAKTKLDIYNYTKTNSSQRIVSMDNILASKLKNYKIIQDEQKKKWGKSYNDLDLVFAREDGNIIDPSTLRDKYMKFLKMAGLKHYKFHALRHTFASRALEANISIKVVSKILGHANVQITMDTYQHVVPELQSEAMNLIADYVAS